ncbi:RlpA-like double-psi beta-barrel-protein domain-containing protein-containing protein [Phellopilus nigrolimitatus]|nr:RlpA-like double-psi beta-barrel-protein domain-containing protein-containing protein [Phellopilus nigrolimitatus]
MSALFATLCLWFCLGLAVAASSEWIAYPSTGFATLTHYTIPLDFVAACGCVPASTHFPTAALSQMAYGSSTAYGPACGRCFNLSLLNTFLSDPPFFPDVAKSVVVKVTDLCPISPSKWCDATQSKPNSAGHDLNFDLAWPSSSIPDDFFPSNASLYGYTDFGVWNISYASVPCASAWAGASNLSDFGAAPNLGTSVCCPADPLSDPNSTCASYSDLFGIPPEAAPGSSSASHTLPSLAHLLSSCLAVLVLFFLL